ncbi:hypothetical protein V8F20_004791 [Naviculisporaceae sp. PSN 640]
MCLKLIFHNPACDVRPRVARGIHGSPIVNPYAAPNPCPQDCQGKEHIAPYLRCLAHKCCMTCAEYVHTGCLSRCSPDKVIDYHVYTQRLRSTPVGVETEEWEPLPTIDSYIPKLRIACPTTPAFRQWRTDLLAKGAMLQQILELMDMVELRLAEELQHQRTEHHICQRLDEDWQRYRRYPDEPRPEICRNKENIERLWEKLGQLSDFLRTAEILLDRYQGHGSSASGVPLSGSDAKSAQDETVNTNEKDNSDVHAEEGDPEEDDPEEAESEEDGSEEKTESGYEEDRDVRFARTISAGIALNAVIMGVDVAPPFAH